MAIIIVPTPSLQSREYLHVTKKVNCSNTTTSESEECFFSLFNCDTPMIQFIDLLDPSDKFKNDFFSFIRQLQVGQTIEVELIDAVTDIVLANIIDNTYGDLTAIGGYPKRLLVWSFVVSWQKVQALEGFGKYKFNFIIKNSAGNIISEKESICFSLQPFDCDEAHGTVRIETLQTGFIQNGFDYRDITTTKTFTAGGFGHVVTVEGWSQQIRWYGRFFPDLPDEEDDFIQDSERIERQIQQKVTNKYKLNLRKLRSNIGVTLTNDNFLADQILISDYNLESYEFYRNREVRKISTDDIYLID